MTNFIYLTWFWTLRCLNKKKKMLWGRTRWKSINTNEQFCLAHPLPFFLVPFYIHTLDISMFLIYFFLISFLSSIQILFSMCWCPKEYSSCSVCFCLQIITPTFFCCFSLRDEFFIYFLYFFFKVMKQNRRTSKSSSSSSSIASHVKSFPLNTI